MSQTAPSKQPLAKIRAANWQEILPRIALPEPAARVAVGAADPVAALEALEKGKFYTEAARLIAYSLPKREAVWWACMCARHTMPGSLPEADKQALEAAEQWVFRGEEAARRDAFAHAGAAGFSTPEAWAGVGAFWSGESIAPAGQPVVPPAPYLAATAISGAVVLAAVRGEPQRREQRLIRFVASGREIAEGGPGRLQPEGE